MSGLLSVLVHVVHDGLEWAVELDARSVRDVKAPSARLRDLRVREVVDSDGELVAREEWALRVRTRAGFEALEAATRAALLEGLELLTDPNRAGELVVHPDPDLDPHSSEPEP
jgi:hypothetical protein